MWKWWRCRELNPGPKKVTVGVYKFRAYYTYGLGTHEPDIHKF